MVSPEKMRFPRAFQAVSGSSEVLRSKCFGVRVLEDISRDYNRPRFQRQGTLREHGEILNFFRIFLDRNQNRCKMNIKYIMKNRGTIWLYRFHCGFSEHVRLFCFRSADGTSPVSGKRQWSPSVKGWEFLCICSGSSSSSEY